MLKFSPTRVSIARSSWRPPYLQRPSLIGRATGSGNGGGTGSQASIDDEPEDPSVSAKLLEEISRRKMNAKDAQATQDPFSAASSRNAGPSWAGDADVPPQLQKSRQLNSEGLEGFIPRAQELLKLALSLTLYFVPAALVVGLAFGGVYSVFGEFFVHRGDPNQKPPAYVDPYDLLSEDTYYGMVPVVPPEQLRN